MTTHEYEWEVVRTKVSVIEICHHLIFWVGRDLSRIVMNVCVQDMPRGMTTVLGCKVCGSLAGQCMSIQPVLS